MTKNHALCLLFSKLCITFVNSKCRFEVIDRIQVKKNILNYPLSVTSYLICMSDNGFLFFYEV